MYTIKTKYRGQGEGVVGHTFDTEREAETFLEANGWRKDPYNVGSWEKAGPTKTCGMIGICIAQYVYIEKQ